LEDEDEDEVEEREEGGWDLDRAWMGVNAKDP